MIRYQIGLRSENDNSLNASDQLDEFWLFETFTRQNSLHKHHLKGGKVFFLNILFIFIPKCWYWKLDGNHLYWTIRCGDRRIFYIWFASMIKNSFKRASTSVCSITLHWTTSVRGYSYDQLVYQLLCKRTGQYSWQCTGVQFFAHWHVMASMFQVYHITDCVCTVPGQFVACRTVYPMLCTDVPGSCYSHNKWFVAW